MSYAHVQAPANGENADSGSFSFFEKWLAVAFQWLGVARGVLVAFFFGAQSGSAFFLF